MSRDADWREANLRIRRLCPEAFVTYTREHAYASRWRAFERMTVPLTLNEDLLTQPGMTKETEACVCAAPTATEVLHKYSLFKRLQRAADVEREQGRTPRFDWQTLFRDRVLRGETEKPLPEPPEWADYKAKMSAHVRESAERTQEQVRATVRNFMALRGGLNPRDMTKDLKRALGIGRLGNDWKGR